MDMLLEETPCALPSRPKQQDKVLVIGAGGFIGTHIVRALIKNGYEIVCGGRDVSSLQSSFPQCSAIKLDFTEIQESSHWHAHLAGIHVVIQASGIFGEHGHNTFSLVHERGPITLFQAAQDMGVRRVIQISALGADEGACTQFHISRKRADDFLAAQKMEWIILFPSLVYGPQERSAHFFKALAALPILPVIDDGKQTVQPLYVGDLAELVVKLVPSSSPSHLRLPIVGPEVFTMKSLFHTYRTWLKFPPTFTVQIPLRLAYGIGHLGNALGWEFCTSEAIAMLSRGSTADDQPFVKLLGRTPTSLPQVLSTRPAQPHDRWYARLYFLVPILRVSIALVWIITALVVLFVYPKAESYTLLAQVGLPGFLIEPLLFSSAFLDLGLGLAMLGNWLIRVVGILQIILIIGYSLVIAIWLPEYLIHPFGPITKNLPLAIATFGLIVLDEKS